MAATLFRADIDKTQSRDLTTDLDLTREELLALLELAEKVKNVPVRYAKALTGRYLSLLFEKPSLRTRLTFELAIKQLGGDSVASVGPIGDREPLKDIARNLDRWTSAIVARTFTQGLSTALRSGRPCPSSTHSATCITPARRLPICSLCASDFGICAA